jgi:undecaprenyl-diphosphatase
MTLAEAVILGVIQGLTEPLPVSSSGHLVIIPALIPGFHQPGVLFDVILHLGTLVAVVFFLRREIGALLFALAPPAWSTAAGHPQDDRERRDNRRMIGLLAAGTFLTGIIGLSFQERIEALFESVTMTAAMLLVTGSLLFLSDRVKKAGRGKGEMTLADGIIIGLAQALALIPGISRSGATITCGIFRGLERRTAARFSFLLSIPAIAGVVVLKSPELLRIPAADGTALAVGFAAAALTGFLSLKLLFALLTRIGLKVFALYCWFAGLATLLYRGFGA